MGRRTKRMENPLRARVALAHVRACVLAIGGLDPGGGAGVVADLRAIAFTGAFGGAVVAVSTVQSTSGLRSARALASREVVAQASEVLRHQHVRAVKIGALGSAGNVRAVARLLGRHPEAPLVLDTPMLPSRGKGRLLDVRAAAALRDELVPRATVVTANAAEAGVLVGEPVRTVGEAHDAARALVVRFGARAALVKGGHLEAHRDTAIDVLAVGDEVVELRARRLPGAGAHGTGCTFASLLAGRIALRRGAGVTTAELVEALRWVKRVHHASLARAVDVGGRSRVLVFEPARRR
jgi:hydroxymethylpyrimidine/phosphomethylpyrimidine kinase